MRRRDFNSLLRIKIIIIFFLLDNSAIAQLSKYKDETEKILQAYDLNITHNDIVYIYKGPKDKDISNKYDIYHGDRNDLQIEIPKGMQYMIISNDTVGLNAHEDSVNRKLPPEALLFFPLDSMSYDLYTDKIESISMGWPLSVSLPAFSSNWKRAVLVEHHGCLSRILIYRKKRSTWILLKVIS